jgi:hypothetical protein
MMRLCLAMLLCCCTSICGVAAAGTIDSLDDVVYWIGTGSQRAAVAFDFDGDSSTNAALVWGFRWDGAATGRDMLNAVVTADARLFAKIGTGLSYENALLGVGYDRDADGVFGVSVGAAFDGDGFAYGPPRNNATPTDPGDWYREGFDFGFWHYGVADGNPWTTAAWTSSQLGAHLRPLVDGSWDSWAFTIHTKPGEFLDKFAQNPVIATPPGGHADFDSSGAVDGHDLLTWQRGVGLAAPWPMDGDAGGDGNVDGLDLSIWTVHFGTNAPTFAAAVPEPPACSASVGLLVALIGSARQQRRYDS